MIKSLFEGVTGLNANALAMGVIGDNIANVGTVGYRAGTASFAELLSQSLETGASGSGVGLWDLSRSWNPGASERTEKVTDLAVEGQGFFMVADDAGTPSYTRAGNFEIDAAGNLVNPDGLRVQGKKVLNAESGLLGNVESIRIPFENDPARATDSLSLTMNLDPEPSPDAVFSTSVMVYDSLATPTGLDFLFTPALDGGGNSLPGRWRWSVSVDPSVADAPVSGGGLLAFDPDGRLDPPACIPAGESPVIEISGLKSGADPLRIEWRYLTDGVSDGSVTAHAGASEVTGQQRNGYPEGALQGVAVDEAGTISGVYSNGNVTPLYRLTLADFTNPYGLIEKGSNLFGQSVASGQPRTGEPATGAFGTIASGVLEKSNVDLNTEFVHMISTQRAFQANSKVVTTSDALLQELMKLKS